MPWKENTTMSLRQEFIRLATQPRANISVLARRFGISRKTAYKWIKRYLEEGPNGLAERSRRPRHSPYQTPHHVEEALVAVRHDNPAWGPRKIRKWILDRIKHGQHRLCADEVPTVSTCAAILRRHRLISPEEATKHTPYQRFERDQPNELWQMDFKGDFALTGGGRCYPLTVLDDHSRFALGLEACANQQKETVQARLTMILRRYGLPEAILCDNGPPWGRADAASWPERYWTELEVWLLRLGVGLCHGRPHHPQTQGKDERFHRTLKAEVLRYEHFDDLSASQRRFDQWRDLYNLERPHEALGLDVPADHYQVSRRVFPESLPLIEYGQADQVRKVQAGGIVHFRGRQFKVGQAFRGYPVALRPSQEDDVWQVYFCHQRIKTLDLGEVDVPV